ncbi:MAG: rod shape-determining protein MreC [Patescibacteria group bacterium]|nr:rod shape-determining protein MreC [Patescibacteria group bacterium]
MKKNGNFIFIFIIFLVLSFISLFAFKNNNLVAVSDLTRGFFSPFERVFLSVARVNTEKGEVKNLKEKNRELEKKLLELESLKKENNALKDQFNTTTLNSLKLLPARVVSAPDFIPGVNTPEVLIIDKGKKDGLVLGLSVVYKDSLVGKIETATDNFSKVNILTKKDFSFTVKTAETGALGVIKGLGENEMTLDNVLLSEKLKENDYVLTKGDVDINGKGLMPDLIVGKIISIDKKSSSLFQTAKVQSLLDLSKISEVFVVIK